MPIIFLIVLAIVILLLFKFGVIFLDRNVFCFQVNPILKRGEIRNIREYRIIHNYIEMLFEKDPDGFNQSPNTKNMNIMINVYYSENS